MLRGFLIAVAAALLAAGGYLWLCGVNAVAAQTLGMGSLLLVAMLFEPWRYRRRILDAAPPGYAPTEEKFEDPASGRRVTVYVKTATGERAYVAEPVSPD